MKLQQELLDFIKSKGTTQSAVCKSLDISESILSSWLKSDYKGSVANVDDKVKKYLKKESKKAILKNIKASFVETTAVKKIYSIADDCYFESEIGICYGGAGIGKTTALKHYVADNTGVILIEADEKTSSGKILRELHEKLGYSGKGSLPSIRKDIVNKLKDSERLVIIDEAENLQYEAFTALRRLHDKTEYTFGLLFVGTTKLYGNLLGMKADFDYLISRIGYCLELDRLNKEDIEKITKTLIPEAKDSLINTLYEQSLGKARVLTKLLARCMKSSNLINEPVCPEMVNSAARVVMAAKGA